MSEKKPRGHLSSGGEELQIVHRPRFDPAEYFESKAEEGKDMVPVSELDQEEEDAAADAGRKQE